MLIIVYAAGFRPALVRVSRGQDFANAVLDVAGNTEKDVPSCVPSQLSERHIAARPLIFSVPAGVEHSKYGDIDYTGDRVVLNSQGKRYVLSTMTGPSCCSGRPIKDEDVAEAFPHVRTWVSLGPKQAKLGGLDLRGRTAEGNWRWLGPPHGSQIEYRNASDEVAQIFDSIIDSICSPNQFPLGKLP